MLPVSRLRWRCLAAWLGLAACLLWPGGAQAGQCEAAQGGGKAILLVSFGTSQGPARQAYQAIETAVRERFPGVPLRWAYTSQKIRQKLSQEGRPVPAPASALASLAEEGFSRVAVQSLHVIPGEEYDGLKQTAQRLAGLPKGLKQIEVGAPLLYNTQDMQRLARALLAHAPKERRPGQALVFLGHGTPHPAQAIYAALAYMLQKLDSHASLGTVSGYPDLETVTQEIKSRGNHKAWLIPLMTVAGEHAHKDMAGGGADSWASQLGQNGIACQPVMQGLAEYPEVVAVWLEHLQAAWDKLAKE